MMAMAHRMSWTPGVSNYYPNIIKSKRNDDNDDDSDNEYVNSALYRQLFPLQEDLAEWINKTIGVDCINGDNFFDALDNGVLVCHLARVIQNRAKEVNRSSSHQWHCNTVPTIRAKCWENAIKRTFFSRDNMDNFLKFCRTLGVHENLLFESDDLVLHHNRRQVVLCLLEVARLAVTRYGLEPPGLVQLEKELELEEEELWQLPTTPTPYWPSNNNSQAMRLLTSPELVINANNNNNNNNVISTSDGVSSDASSRGSAEDPDFLDDYGQTLTELDRRVREATRLMQQNCNCRNGKCAKLKVRKVGEGKYNIAGRNVFIRLLKGRHMMVRVGGGWDTLDHFLLRHDPCQVKVISRSNTPPAPDRRASLDNYLHIRAKYRSPPPREREAITR